MTGKKNKIIKTKSKKNIIQLVSNHYMSLVEQGQTQVKDKLKLFLENSNNNSSNDNNKCCGELITGKFYKCLS